MRQSATAPELLFEALIQLGPFAQWTMDCKLSPSLRNAETQQNQHDWAAALDIGMSDNAVETFDLQMRAGRLVSHGFVPVTNALQRNTGQPIYFRAVSLSTLRTHLQNRKPMLLFRCLTRLGDLSAQSIHYCTQCPCSRQVSLITQLFGVCCNFMAQVCCSTRS